ncbi:MAG: divergent polysaccharide deacetylase family protein [Magnetococcus sp. YQC-5]
MTDEPMPDPDAPPPSKRGWVVFTLIALVLFVAGVGVGHFWKDRSFPWPHRSGTSSPVRNADVSTGAIPQTTTAGGGSAANTLSVAGVALASSVTPGPNPHSSATGESPHVVDSTSRNGSAGPGDHSKSVSSGKESVDSANQKTSTVPSVVNLPGQQTSTVPSVVNLPGQQTSTVSSVVSSTSQMTSTLPSAVKESAVSPDKQTASFPLVMEKQPDFIGPPFLMPHGEALTPRSENTDHPAATGSDDLGIHLQYEENLPQEPPFDEPSPRPVDPAERGIPKVAVIIDDLGYNGEVSLAIARLSEAITLAILPGGEFSSQTAKIGKATNKEVILHQPMEPLGYPRIKPGPGAMLMGMDAEQLRQVLQKNLQLFPGAVGINNHMGSRLTENREAMDVVMEALQERGLFFVDSRTSQSSVAYGRAQARGLPSTRRDVFLDNSLKASAIDARLAELERIARHTGRAVGIGHPYRETLHALQRWLPQAIKRGVRVVPVSQFLHSGSAMRRAPSAAASVTPVAESVKRRTPPSYPEPPAEPQHESGKTLQLKQDTSLKKPLLIKSKPVVKTSSGSKETPVLQQQSPSEDQSPVIQDPTEHVLPVDQSP